MSDRISGRQCTSNVIVSTGPDVCLTPVGSSLVPVAYSSVSFLGESTRVSSTVLDNGDPDFHLNSRACTSTGHEAGVGAGVVAPGYQGEAFVQTASPTVFTDGWATTRHRDPAMINRPDSGAVEPQFERTHYPDAILRRVEARGEAESLDEHYGSDFEAELPARDVEPGTNESVESANGAAKLVTGASAPPERDMRQRPGETDEEYLRRLESEIVNWPRPRNKEQLREAIAGAEAATAAIVEHPNLYAWRQHMDPAMFHDPLSFEGVTLDEPMSRVANGDPAYMARLLEVGNPYSFAGADGRAYNAAGEDVMPQVSRTETPNVGVNGTLAMINDRYKWWREALGDPVPDPEWSLADRMEAAKAARDQGKRMNRMGLLITGNATTYIPETAGIPDFSPF